MHASYNPSGRNPCETPVLYLTPNLIYVCQLLETMGIISSSDARSAASNITNYQDSATDPFGEDSEEAAVLREDEPEDDSNWGSSHIDLNAICKVRIPLHLDPSHS
jgi:hypothetical protein